MKPIDLIIIALVIVAVYFAIKHVKKNKGTCDCGCQKGCSGCASHKIDVKNN
ncbi:FeoB-associated Cys-rich membrane protein [Peptoniphilus sp.]|uniref:FeoB-associated Cys-rich membrane protein n=1 Tax=Peptoniphilus sp. TaxID=1971214 RepID=UPI0039912C00